MTRYALLLRGVNLGPKRRLAMADLRTLLERDGYTDVATYVQSGNVVLGSELPIQELPTAVAQLIAGRFGFEVPILARTARELAAVVAGDPIDGAAADPKHYQVTFLDAEPTAAAIERLRSRATASERVAARGREIYSWHPDGIGRSKLASALSHKALGSGATARNWTTVVTLMQMAAA